MSEIFEQIGYYGDDVDPADLARLALGYNGLVYPGLMGSLGGGGYIEVNGPEDLGLDENWMPIKKEPDE